MGTAEEVIELMNVLPEQLQAEVADLGRCVGLHLGPDNPD